MREVVVAAAQLAVSPLTQTRKARRRHRLPPPTARPRRESRSASPDVLSFFVFIFFFHSFNLQCFVYLKAGFTIFHPLNRNTISRWLLWDRADRSHFYSWWGAGGSRETHVQHFSRLVCIAISKDHHHRVRLSKKGGLSPTR